MMNNRKKIRKIVKRKIIKVLGNNEKIELIYIV